MAPKTTKSTIKKDPDGTITVTLTIPAEEIKKEWDSEVNNIAQNITIEGFRKGKAPRDIVEKQINRDKVKEDVLKKLLPKIYSDAIQEHNLKPILAPKIHVESLEDGKEWICHALVCETPVVQLGNYKDAVKKITAKSKIIIPGKEQKEPSLEEVIKPLLDTAQVTIPHILTDGEVERLLAQLLDEVKQLGLTLDQYIASTGKTVDAIRKEYQQKAENDIKLEFVLQKVAEEENITVEQGEIDEAIQKAKSETEKESLEQNMYLLASILRQQKTLDFLKKL